MKSMAANRNEVVVVVVVVVVLVFIVVVVGRYHDVTVVVWHCREREREEGGATGKGHYLIRAFSFVVLNGTRVSSSTGDLLLDSWLALHCKLACARANKLHYALVHFGAFVLLHLLYFTGLGCAGWRQGTVGDGDFSARV